MGLSALLVALKVVHRAEQLTQLEGTFAIQSLGKCSLNLLKRKVRKEIAGARDKGT